MPYRVQFTQDAQDQLLALRKTDSVKVVDQCQRLLSVHPTQVSKARIKRLRGTTSPAYRLRVDDFRVFYDVDENAQTVTVLGVVAKEQASQWLANFTGGAARSGSPRRTKRIPAWEGPQVAAPKENKRKEQDGKNTSEDQG